MKKFLKKLVSEKVSIGLIIFGIFLILMGLLFFLWHELDHSFSDPINK